ncbi:hypothetical protein HFO97_30775 [Rhizobium leguminosarum]|uniref:hypothetical protein n=1 Tax=Rhizobium leguminosarum TaxID=384 RepID=UPI001C978196|nr:hypothetical protein [Rhizobium leguminosarum]MBY5364254.1 hypothetical protein [Rhizobium leguminosarum]
MASSSEPGVKGTAALALAILNKAFPSSDAALSPHARQTKKQDHAAAGMMPALHPAIAASHQAPATGVPSKPNNLVSPSALRPRLLVKNYRRARFNAARIYRGFWTNGNGFLRGIQIGLIS